MSKLVSTLEQIAEAMDKAIAEGASIRTIDGLGTLAERMVSHDREAAHHGPNRTRAKVAGDDGRERSVPVTRRTCRACSYRGPHGLGFDGGTVEFLGDSKRSGPCSLCGSWAWRD